MSGERAIDDGRWPDAEGFADCFLCGRIIDPLDPKRGTYVLQNGLLAVPIHVPCIAPHVTAGGIDVRVELMLRRYLAEMAENQIRRHRATA